MSRGKYAMRVHCFEVGHHFLVAALLASTLLLPADGAWAWGYEGHYQICELANRLLPGTQQNRLARLVESYRGPNGWRYRRYAPACILPDLARARVREGVAGWQRYQRFDKWHYMNVLRSQKPADIEGCERDCVTAAISYHQLQASRRDIPDGDRARALIFLGHWIADIHQPLHVGYADDLGGNTIALRGGYYRDISNLHALWDVGILDKILVSRSREDYSRYLLAGISAAERQLWPASSALAWAGESLELGRRPGLGYCMIRGDNCVMQRTSRQLDERYQRRFGKEVDKRLRRAAVRLAASLSRILKEPSKAPWQRAKPRDGYP